jgi:hypothetical protein
MQVDAISPTHSGILQLSIYTLTFSVTTNAASISFVENYLDCLVVFSAQGYAFVTGTVLRNCMTSEWMEYESAEISGTARRLSSPAKVEIELLHALGLFCIAAGCDRMSAKRLATGRPASSGGKRRTAEREI